MDGCILDAGSNNLHADTNFSGPFVLQERILRPRGGGGWGTLGISRWGCAARTLEPLTYTRASSARFEFCYPILE